MIVPTDPAKGVTAQIDSKRINAIEGPGLILNCFILVVERATYEGEWHASRPAPLQPYVSIRRR